MEWNLIRNSQRLLVSVFNDILTIEESELKNHNLMIYPLRRCTQSKQLVCTRKTSSEVAKELSITVGTLTVAINNLVKKAMLNVCVVKMIDVVKAWLNQKGKITF